MPPCCRRGVWFLEGKEGGGRTERRRREQRERTQDDGTSGIKEYTRTNKEKEKKYRCDR
jgi:hypothetical protein